MTKLISRPKIESSRETWEEIFFTDLEGQMTVWQLVEQLIWIIEVYTIILKMDVLW